jgi:two-component system, OmpR family, sensor histidine kinase PhoQ
MSQSNTTDKNYSLQTRLVVAFGLLLILFLGLAAIVLVRAYSKSVQAGVEERLQLQVYALAGVADFEQRTGQFFLPDLEEARFSQIDSGLYGFIFDSEGKEVWRSPSALNLNLPQEKFLDGTIVRGSTVYDSLETADQGELSWLSWGSYWENLGQSYNFVVMESTAPTDAQIRAFTSNIFIWFTALAVFLSIAQYLLLRWGMWPLQKLAADVSAIEAGEQDQLQSTYPTELLPVTHNLNILIKSERDRQARYRATLGDLAHSLKTPLAVLSTALQELQQTRNFTEQHRLDMAEQLNRMDQIVSYQLKRAVKSNQTKLLARPVPVAPVFNRILGALNKVYRDKNMAVVCALADDAVFYGEESDLMELAGNLLDNAFKYGNSKVLVSASQKKKLLYLEINDDGNGIAESDRSWVLERGARADTMKSGQGIGLAVAVEIVSSYGGEIQIDQNEWGGARVKVRLGQ